MEENRIKIFKYGEPFYGNIYENGESSYSIYD